jgi:phosphoribosyl 1,2-cyclic phosphodiesterase
MFNFYSLYSGSSGNSLLVQTENTNLLIDAGVSCKKIETALSNLHIEPTSLDGILITHEHIDHVQGLGTMSKKYNLPIYVNLETLDAMPKQKDKISEKNIKTFKVSEQFMINDLTIKPFSIPHDAANPCGFGISKDTKKISIATDIGHITKDILKNLEGSLFVLLEANYDPNVLKCSKYPFSLKTRIAGPTGHLSNELAGKTLSHLLQSGLQGAMLGHLSKESNFPELAYKTVIDELLQNNYDENSLKLSVAKRDELSSQITI